MAVAIRVLYVDDESPLLELGKVFLEKSGDFTVTTATSAPDAIRLLEKKKFDVIVADYQMPEMDGIEFLVEVRTKFGEIPFILFTGKGREEVVIKALNAGADGYLQKGGEPSAQFAELAHKIKAAASRKRVDDALRTSEEKYRHLIEHADEAIVVVQEGMVKLVNHRTVELTGYSKQELLSTSISAYIHPDDRAMVMERYQKRMKGEESPSRYTFRLGSKDGSIRWVEISISSIDWEERPATLNFFTDITERKRAEEAIQYSETRFKELFNSISSGVAVYKAVDDGADFVFVDFNRAAETIDKIKKEDVIGRSVSEVFPSVSKFGLLEVFCRVWRTGQEEHHPITQYKDERILGWRDNFVYRLPSGEIVAVYDDVTESKRAEDALRKSELDLKEAQRVSHVGSWDLNVVTGDLRWSDECYSIYGFRPQEFVPTYEKFRSIVHPEDLGFVQEQVDAALNNDKHYNVDFRFVRPDGEIGWIHCEGEVTRDAEGKPLRLFGTQIDITERKQAEDTIKSTLAEKEVLLREIHHRVKNNLAGIISLIDLQLGSVSDPVTISLLKDLETRIRSMALVHESLYRVKDLAHISFTSYTEELTRYLFQVYGTTTDIRCRIEMGDVTMPIETAIPCGLVMTEIVTNSLKYAFPHTFFCQEIRGDPCTITLSLHREGSDYLLTIADNGIGIPEGIDVTMSHALGLFLIGFIVKHQLRGSLEISTAGGTAYTIRFPEPEVKERHSDE